MPKFISCENFSAQSSSLSQAADTVYRCLATGKRYYWTGSAWSEYFEFSQGANIVVTPLAQSLPRASIADKRVVDSPYFVEPVDNIVRVSSLAALPVAGATYAVLMISPYTTTITAVQCYIGSSLGTVQFAVYSSLGALLGKTTALSAGSAGMRMAAIATDSAGNSISKVSVTGGSGYYIAVTSAAATTFYSIGSLPTASVTGIVAPQAYAATALPSSIALNSNNVATLPWLGVICS